ncbi:MAG: glycosyltransferase [Parcubacteria group bacterium]|jgi:glycosyltransferase involved in cell wall biosynthesis
MKILEINKFNHIRGGADKHFIDLARLFESNGDEVGVFAMSHPENLHSDFSKYFVSRVDFENGSLFNKMKGAFRVFWSFEATRKIAKLLDEFQPDVIHIHNIYHQISPSILLEIKKRRIPIVMTVHDWKLICPNYLLNCEEPYCKKCVAGKYWHCVSKKCVKNSYAKSLIAVLGLYFHRWLKIYEKNVDLYIAPSRFVKNILVQAGFPEKKIKVLAHFASVQDSQNGKDANGENYALYFGRISKEKNVDELIEIFKSLPIKLVLAGNREAGFEIPRHPNIKYAGFKNSVELAKLIKNSSFVVSASKLAETFGLVALEAISAEKPFVGYDVGGYGEMIENGANGYLVKNKEEFKSKILEYASGKATKFKFQADKFSPERYYVGIVDIFQSIC